MQKIDGDFIFFCTEDARKKQREIAKLLRRSPQRLKYTLQTYERQRIIHSPYAVIDYAYFGLLLFRVYFKSGYIAEKDREKILRILESHTYVVAAYEYSGEFDLCIEMMAPNASRFNKELRALCTSIPTFNNYKIILNIVSHIYPRNYLTRRTLLVGQEIVIGGDRSLATFTDLEKKVIEKLWFHPRIRLTSLARETQSHVQTAKNTLESLHHKKIIRGTKYLLDSEQLGIYKFRMFLKLHNTSAEREKELLDFLRQTKEVFQVHKTVGDWDLEIDIESFEKTKNRYLMLSLRETYKDMIASFSIIEFFAMYKRTYLPAQIFS